MDMISCFSKTISWGLVAITFITESISHHLSAGIGQIESVYCSIIMNFQGLTFLAFALFIIAFEGDFSFLRDIIIVN